MPYRAAVEAAHPWRSIRVRFTLLYVATLGALLALAAVVLYVTAEAIVIRETDEALATRAATILDDTTPAHDALDVGVLQDAAFHVGKVYPDYFYYAFFPQAASGSGQYSTTAAGYPGIRRMLGHALRTVAPRDFDFDTIDGGESMRVLVLPSRQTHQMLVVATPWDPNEYRLARLTAILVELMAVVLFAAGIGSYVLIGRTLKPIDALVRRAERLSVDRIHTELLPERAAVDTELKHLVRALNGMVDRLHAALHAQRQFAADASHELRTPLTILRGEVDLALQKQRSADEYRAVLNSSLEEAKRLSRIVEALGVLARGDASEWRSAQYSDVDLAGLLQSIVDGFSNAAETSGIALDFETTAEATVEGDKDAIRRALSNLIENALHYTPKGGRVTVMLEASGDSTLVSVKDTGVGIDETELPRVFDRFFRSPRTRGLSEGSGLGLAIAASIVRAHGGEITVHSVVGRGSTFQVRLPTKRA